MFLGKVLQTVTAAMKLKTLAPWKRSYEKPRQCIKKPRHPFADKVYIVKPMVFSSSHARMWELDHKEGWALKNWWLLTVVLKKTLESPLESKEIKPVNPKGNQPWVFIGRTDAEAPIIWLPDEKSQLTGKDPDDGKDWRQQEKGTTEVEDGCMASPTQWTWVWANWWWRTGKADMLLSMGLQRVGHDWVTEQQESHRQFTVNFRCLEIHYVLDNWHKPWQRFL